MRLKHIAVVALVGSMFLLGACGDDEGGSSDDGGGEASSSTAVDVTAADFAFDKDSIDVEAGSEVEVTLTNEDDTEHSFSIEDPEFEIEAEGGDSATGTFTASDEGSVEFFCKYHPDQMRGELTIGGSAAGGGGDTTSDGGDNTEEGGPYSD